MNDLKNTQVTALLNSNPPVSVFTHQHVDADAAFSVAAWAVLTDRSVDQLDLHFVDSPDAVPQGAIALDLIGGVKGFQSCCFAELVFYFGEDDLKILRSLATYLTKVDRRERYENGLPPGMFYLLPANIIGGLRMNGSDDFDLCNWAEEYLRAILVQGKRFQRMDQELPAGTQRLMNGRVILLPKGAARVSASAAFKQGAEFVIYQDGHSVGIQRRDTSKFNFESLRPLLPDGFYFDPRGSLIAWGTIKVPKDTRSPISGEVLANKLIAEIKRKELRRSV